MKVGKKEILTIAVVAVVLSMAYTWVVYPSEEDSIEFTGEVIGLSSYNQPKLDLSAQEIFDSGLNLGAEFTIITETDTYTGAIMLKSYLGILMFDIFVNVEDDGLVSVGCVGMLISAEEGSQIKLVHTGESQRYKNTPDYNVEYSQDIHDFPSTEVFANFYEVTGGNIAPGVLYRSFSSLSDPAKQARVPYVNQLAEENSINYVIALSFSDASVQSAISKYEGYCIDLCKDGKYVAPSMGYLYFQQKEKTIDVLQSIIDNDGPYLVHCNIGRDRTGFVVLLLQALCGCTAEEMIECEARAFCNLYGIDPGTKEYNYIVSGTYDRNMYLIVNYDNIDNILHMDWSKIDVSMIDTQKAAYQYCTDYLGLSSSQVNSLLERLTVVG